jgi:hypothetical protein
MSLRVIDERADLRADCGRCAGLCCTAPAFAASADFAIDKPAGRSCPMLQADFRCGIHAQLRERGFPGCAVFDCFGAGQHVVQVTFGGRDWRRSPETAEAMFAVFPVARQLKEVLWYLAEAATLVGSSALLDEVAVMREQTNTLLARAPDQLVTFDAVAHRREVGALLKRVSQKVRDQIPHRASDREGADLIGAKLRGSDLHGASLRGAYLLGADLRRADLQFADLLGTDLRGADLRGARLAESLFLTQPQLEATMGNASTTVPVALTRPRHWSSTGGQQSNGSSAPATGSG